MRACALGVRRILGASALGILCFLCVLVAITP